VAETAAIAGSRPPARLIVNADDFGISPRINEGILMAHRQGIVTATSLMAVGGAFDEGVELLHSCPSLDVGVHLTLVGGRPLRPAPSLVGADGCFPENFGVFVRRWLQGGVRLVEVEGEWRAQIERILASGIRPSHLDSHQHLHGLPGLAALSQRLAEHYGIAWVRVPLESPRVWLRSTPPGLGRVVGGATLGCCWLLARLAGARKPRRGTPRFLGFHDGGRLDHIRLQRLLGDLQPGEVYELMCHPGLTPDEPRLRVWQYGHQGELEALTAPSLREELAAHGVRLCRFTDLARAQFFSPT
jgi:chitin disaccharide deacetylase